MKQSKHIEWLHDQLPDWVSQGLLSESSAAAIKQRYPLAQERSGIPLAFLFFGVLGALLIGAGIILLLAHNWQELGRPARTVISLAPLVLAQVITAWVLFGGMSGRGAAGQSEPGVVWRESAAVFHSLAVAASIALIAQTYHMPGSLDTFLITWMLLSLPLVYVLRAVTPLLIYLAGITAWAIDLRQMGLHAVLYWPLLALALPFIASTVRTAPFSTRSALVLWSSIIAVSSALGFVLGKGMPKGTRKSLLLA